MRGRYDGQDAEEDCIVTRCGRYGAGGGDEDAGAAAGRRQGGEGENPLHCGAARGRMKAVRGGEAGAVMNAKDATGGRPLMWAQQGQLEKALVESVVLTPRPRPDQQRQCRLSLHHHVRPPSRTNIHIATSQPSKPPSSNSFQTTVKFLAPLLSCYLPVVRSTPTPQSTARRTVAPCSRLVARTSAHL